MRTPDMPAGGRRTGAVIVAALTVAAVVVGVAAISLPGSSPDRSPQPASSDSAVSVIDLDQGPGADPEAVASCAGPDFASDPETSEVLYDVVQLAAAGTSSVLVLRNPEGELRLCDMAGADAPAVLPLPEATEADPVAFLSNGTAAWDCDGMALGSYRSTTWLLVADGVERVEQRFVVDGAPEPWFSTQAVDGIAHLQTWLGPLPEGVRIAVEQRALDAAGEPVEQDTLPSRAPLPGCTTGDVQIG